MLPNEKCHVVYKRVLLIPNYVDGIDIMAYISRIHHENDVTWREVELHGFKQFHELLRHCFAVFQSRKLTSAVDIETGLTVAPTPLL